MDNLTKRVGMLSKCKSFICLILWGKNSGNNSTSLKGEILSKLYSTAKRIYKFMKIVSCSSLASTAGRVSYPYLTQNRNNTWDWKWGTPLSNFVGSGDKH